MSPMAEREPKQTRIVKMPDGRFVTYCRICPKRAWRNLEPDERTGVPLATAREAEDQGRRHRKSDFHQQAVKRAAHTAPSPEEEMLAWIFGARTRQPCAECGHHHAAALSCARAAAIRSGDWHSAG